MDKERLVKETIVMLAADLFYTLVNRDDSKGWGDAAGDIIYYAEKFENELDWQENDERDYIEELEKYERKILDELDNK